MRLILIEVLACGLGWLGTTHAAPTSADANPSAQQEIQVRLDRGFRFLLGHQKADGSWSDPAHPALTALPLLALQGDPTLRAPKNHAPSMARGYALLRQHAHPDGSIAVEGRLPNYNTAISLLALSQAGEPEDRPLIRRGRNYLIGQQWDVNEKGRIDSPFDGGIGYGSHPVNSDMSNTLFALEALYYTREVVPADNPSLEPDLNWKAVLNFIQSCQNLPSHNRQPWASDDPANRGGFVYHPEQSKAGSVELPSGKVALRSYGSISYAGMLSYIYADLKPDDPRVEAVFEWLQKNYTLQENPGMGQQGLYYYYHTLAKALTLKGTTSLTTPDGRKVDWREQLFLRLAGLQRPDGSWVNDNPRWMEDDATLTTAYTLIALERLHRSYDGR